MRILPTSRVALLLYGINTLVICAVVVLFFRGEHQTLRSLLLIELALSNIAAVLAERRAVHAREIDALRQ